MADVMQLKNLVDAYGVAVRAGVITPCTEDEVYFRKLMDLPDMPASVAADWKESKGVRHPITTKAGLEQDYELPETNQDETETGANDDE